MSLFGKKKDFEDMKVGDIFDAIEKRKDKGGPTVDQFDKLLEKAFRLYNEGQLEHFAALRFFKKVVRKEPKCLIAWLHIIDIYLDATPDPCFKDALNMCDKALEKIGDNKVLHQKRFEVLFKEAIYFYNKQDFQKSLHFLNKALTINSKHEEALNYKRFIKFELEKLETHNP